MPRTALTVTDAPKSTAIVGAVITMDTGDATDDNDFVLTGREIVLIKNASVDTARIIEISSAPCEHGRSADISHSIPFGEVHMFAPRHAGWRQASGKVFMSPATTDIKVGVVRLPI